MSEEVKTEATEAVETVEAKKKAEKAKPTEAQLKAEIRNLKKQIEEKDMQLEADKKFIESMKIKMNECTTANERMAGKYTRITKFVMDAISVCFRTITMAFEEEV